MTTIRHCQTHQLPTDSLLIIFIHHDLITDQQSQVLHSARELAYLLPDVSWRYVSNINGQPVYTSRDRTWDDWLQQSDVLQKSFSTASFRSLLMEMENQVFELIASASQLLTWEQEHNFCSRCGSKTRMHSHENAMCCDACNYRQYPRINPCIIALIHKDNEILLAHNASFKAGYFSCIAGFIDPGESVEQAVHREIFEEVGIKVKAPRYFSSQSWPFPHSLMLGFLCEYDSGDICVDGHEITEARWGAPDDFPLRPGTATISGQLIQAFIDARV